MLHLTLPLIVLLLLSFAAPLVLNALVPPAVTRAEMTASPVVDEALLGPTNTPYGFYPPETSPDGLTYRWTGPQADITFPYAGNLGRHATVAIRMASSGYAGAAPVTAKIIINGSEIQTANVTPAFEVFTVKVDTQQLPNPYLDPAHIQVGLASPTFVSPDDGRTLGLEVDWIETRPERSRGEVLLEAMVWAICAGAVVLVARSRLGVRWSAFFGSGLLLTLAVLHCTYIARELPLTGEVALAGLAWFAAACIAPRERPLWGLVLAGCGTWVVVAGRLLGEWQLDDAYISYRYAWNLVHGNGLVYNPGEVVEGYTNFLWTVLAAASIGIGLPPATVALAATVALSIALLSLVWLASARLAGKQYFWPAIVCLLLAGNSAFVTYGPRGSGMEAMLFAVLTMLAAVLLYREPTGVRQNYVSAGIVLSLATLTRPEGVVLALLFIGVRCAQLGAAQKPWRSPLLYSAGAYAAVVVPHELWRIFYYGYPLPNTFYAKVGTATTEVLARGWVYVQFFLLENWLPAVLGLIGLLVFVAGWRRSGVLTALALFVAVQAGYVLWIGGDHFPGWRFFVPVIAPLLIVGQEAVRRLIAWLPSPTSLRVATYAVLALAALAYVGTMREQTEPDSYTMETTRLHTAYVEHWGSAGLWLKDNTPPEARTAAKGAGAIAYYGQRPTIDMFGLNDLHIGHLKVDAMGAREAGHDKTDPQYVLDLKPVYILAEWTGYFDSYKADLDRDYVPFSSRSPTGMPVEWVKRK
ncbi:MAG TPA: hypothetical protein VGE04_20025 [Chloroflexia bacterium]